MRPIIFMLVALVASIGVTITHSILAAFLVVAVALLVRRTLVRKRRKIVPEPQLEIYFTIRQIRMQAENLKYKPARECLLSICKKAEKLRRREPVSDSGLQLDLNNIAAVTKSLNAMRKSNLPAAFEKFEPDLRRFENKLIADLDKRDRVLEDEAETRISFLSTTGAPDELEEAESPPDKKPHAKKSERPPDNFADALESIKQADRNRDK